MRYFVGYVLFAVLVETSGTIVINVDDYLQNYKTHDPVENIFTYNIVSMHMSRLV